MRAGSSVIFIMASASAFVSEHGITYPSWPSEINSGQAPVDVRFGHRSSVPLRVDWANPIGTENRAGVHLLKEYRFGVEDEVDGLHRDARGRRDIGHCGRLIATGSEQLVGDGEDALPGSAGPLAPN